MSWYSGPWHVYRLLDPRTSEPFYIGCSINPRKRLLGHRYDPASSAWPRCVELRKLGLIPGLEILSEHTNRYDALMTEWRLIITTPGLVNASTLSPTVWLCGDGYNSAAVH